jgi:hypothetical protein
MGVPGLPTPHASCVRNRRSGTRPRLAGTPRRLSGQPPLEGGEGLQSVGVGLTTDDPHDQLEKTPHPRAPHRPLAAKPTRRAGETLTRPTTPASNAADERGWQTSAPHHSSGPLARFSNGLERTESRVERSAIAAGDA